MTPGVYSDNPVMKIRFSLKYLQYFDESRISRQNLIFDASPPYREGELHLNQMSISTRKKYPELSIIFYIEKVRDGKCKF